MTRKRIRWKDLFGKPHVGELVSVDVGGCWVEKKDGAPGFCFVAAAWILAGRPGSRRRVSGAGRRSGASRLPVLTGDR